MFYLPQSAGQALGIVMLFMLANLGLGFLRTVFVAESPPKIIALRRTDSGRNVAVAVDQPPEEGIRQDFCHSFFENPYRLVRQLYFSVVLSAFSGTFTP